MTYLPPSGRDPIPHDQLRRLAEMLDLTLPEEDLEPLSAALPDQLAAAERLDVLDLDGIGPALHFDPRWYD